MTGLLTGRSGVTDAVESVKASGILAATVPARLGGPELPPSQIAAAVRDLAATDGSLGQIPQSHFVFSRWLFDGEHPEAEQWWADRLLSGTLIANAQAEREPVILDRGRLTGRKVFCTGSPYADVLVVTARRPGEDAQSLAVFLPADTPGVTVVDDWDALGQRSTGSGTVIFEDAEAGPVYDRARALNLPGYGAFAQLLHAAIDVGIAGAALDAALGVTSSTDVLTAALAGELTAQRFAAEAVVEKAGRALDELVAGRRTDRAAVALEVAAAKVTTGSLTVDLASRLFELTGTRGVDPAADLDRFWRDLRTHTLHERRRDKLAVLGRAVLTGIPPELGPQL
ncbi:acyl-CoA dehydrogenase family protein [Corynebacterium terpenotabidum]|uniref:Dibenzothiophene monooxygenase n=1 Tax=Corynebacterium terpenotabidum Y-11 TaxID=1200352 RepID=S4XLV8_9CORY|nr:acyl-CoA dehydrogenase family protein [Corynebacterium terpenotabidum]AGP31593.1 acyl-CoA dehydrogenase type 2 domain-containing protein [Corynebacterium terpenotabidum Y-11]